MKDLNLYLEQTILSPTLREADVDKLVEDAILHRFFGICLPPFWVKKAKRNLPAEISLVTVIGFPLGYNRTETKLKEAEIAMQDGADELDLVMNHGAFLANPNEWVKIELARMALLAHEAEKMLKVIIETAYLDKNGIELACKICADAGVDFVKTSTGFAPKGADADDVRFMRSVLPAHIGIKASGGIRTYDDAVRMIEAGADRIGTSSAVAILAGIAK